MTAFYDGEIEQQIISAMFRNNELIDKLAFLQADDFYFPLHKEIWQHSQAAFAHNNITTALSLKSALEQSRYLKDAGGATYLAKLATLIPVANNWVDLAKLLIDMRQKREIEAFAKELIERVAARTPVEHVADMVAFAEKILESEANSGFLNGYQVSELIESEMKADSKPIQTRIGYKLDECMDGGIYRGKSYGFAARKKVGKTLLAATLSFNLAQQGIKHLFIAGEMTPEEIHQRILARTGNFYQSAFRLRNKDADFQAQFTKSLGWQQQNVIYKKAPGLTFDKLKQIVNIAIKRYKVEGIILDYWQLVGGKKANQSIAEHLDEVAQYLADTGRKYNIFIVCMAQINQEGNTRGSEGLRLAFDQVYQIHREEMETNEAWIEMLETRYTKWLDIGTKERAGWRIGATGTFFEEI